MTMIESEGLLLEKAQEEERKFNWIEAATLYEKVVKLYLDKNQDERVAFFYDHFRLLQSTYSDLLLKNPWTIKNRSYK